MEEFLFGPGRVRRWHYSVTKSKIESMMYFKLFVVASLFLSCWTSSIQASDHHPLQIVLDDLGK
jgi:pterin-4a-carbinolamine dehydratase